MITFWGIIELIIKEGVNGGSDGKGTTSTPCSRSMLIPPTINPLVLLACLQLSQIVCSPLNLEKSCGGGSVTLLMFLLESGVGGGQGVRESGLDRRLLTRLFTFFYFSSIFL